MGPAKNKVLGEVVEQLLQWDPIPSKSSTSSHVALVWQHDKWKFSLYFRTSNAVTKNDPYLMLRSDYIFSAMSGKRNFFLLDTIKGYDPVEKKPEDRHKTAFISHCGLY